MAKNRLALEQQSSEKEALNGQSDKISSVFWFPVYEGLFEHAPTISDAVWLFMWLIARTTRESNGSGSVLGGVPIHDERIGGELGFPRKTIRRWRLMLVAGCYISTVRTPYGFRYILLKSKKWQKQAVTEVPKLPISLEEKSQNGHREVPLREERSPKTVISKKTTQRQYKDNTGRASETATAPPSPFNIVEDLKTKTDDELESLPWNYGNLVAGALKRAVSKEKMRRALDRHLGCISEEEL